MHSLTQLHQDFTGMILMVMCLSHLHFYGSLRMCEFLFYLFWGEFPFLQKCCSCCMGESSSVPSPSWAGCASPQVGCDGIQWLLWFGLYPPLLTLGPTRSRDWSHFSQVIKAHCKKHFSHLQPLGPALPGLSAAEPSFSQE